MLVDPFAAGRILTADEAHDRMQEIFGEEAEWSEDLLKPASNRHWLTRMLQNLLNIFGSAGASTTTWRRCWRWKSCSGPSRCGFSATWRWCWRGWG